MHTQKLRESNLKVLKKCFVENEGIDNELLKFRESFQRKFGFDYLDEKRLPFMESGFDIKKAKQIMIESGKFKEADDSAGFQQLLRAGVMQGINIGMYENVDTIYKDICTIFPSKKDTELIAPLTGIGFPNQIARGGKYPEVGLYGIDMSLQTRTFGAMHSISSWLEQDDQTAQVQNGSRLLGQYMDTVIEVWMMAKLASVPTTTAAMTYANLTCFPSETRPSAEPSTWPYSISSTTGFVGGGYNRPTTFVALNQSNIQNGYAALRVQKNQLGVRMAVEPNVLLVTPKYFFDAAVVANSTYYATNVYNASATNATAQVGAPMAVNPLQGLFKPIQGRYIFNYDGTNNGDSTAWWLLDTKKPWFFINMRNAPAVYVEAPNSGRSFENDESRTKVNMRMNGDIAEPRFMWKGNDGSV